MQTRSIVFKTFKCYNTFLDYPDLDAGQENSMASGKAGD